MLSKVKVNCVEMNCVFPNQKLSLITQDTNMHNKQTVTPETPFLCDTILLLLKSATGNNERTDEMDIANYYKGLINI